MNPLLGYVDKIKLFEERFSWAKPLTDFSRSKVRYKVSPSGKEVMALFFTKTQKNYANSIIIGGDGMRIGLIVLCPRCVAEFCKELDCLEGNEACKFIEKLAK